MFLYLYLKKKDIQFKEVKYIYDQKKLVGVRPRSRKTNCEQIIIYKFHFNFDSFICVIIFSTVSRFFCSRFLVVKEITYLKR